MPSITFVTHDGVCHVVPGRIGASLMEAAIANNVPGIDADCGGACACATCHVFIEGVWAGKQAPAGPMESSMLEFADEVRPTSRLACQIRLGPEHNGLVVHLPVSQH